MTGCHRSCCETCCWDWLERATRRATTRILEYELGKWKQAHPGAGPQRWAETVLEDSDGELQYARVVHAVTSFDQDQGEWPGVDRYKQARREAGQHAKDAGLNGLAVIPHPYRIDPWMKEKLREAGYGRHGTEGSLWEGVIEDALELEDFRAYVVDGLHYHLVGISGQRGTPDADVEPGEDPETFWKNIGTCDTVMDVWRSFRYLGSHVAPPPTTAWATWYGRLAKVASGPLDELDDLDRFFVQHVISQVVGRRGTEDGGCPCPDCESRQAWPIYRANRFLRLADEQDVDVEWRDSLDVARRWSLYGAEFAVRRAVELGWVDPCLEHQDPDERDPDWAKAILALDRPPPDPSEPALTEP